MLRNNNKKFIKTLSANCLKANKHRNMIAIVAILLTAMLFTSIATVLQGSMYCIKQQRIEQSGSKAMVSLKYMAEKKCKEIMSNPAFDQVGVIRYVGRATDSKLDRINVNVAEMNESLYELNYMKLKEGRLPVNKNEVVLDTRVLDLLGLPHKTGISFTLNYAMDGKEKVQEVQVSGFWKGDKDELTSYIGVSKAFADQALNGYGKPKDGEAKAGALVIMGTLKSEKDLNQQLDTIIKAAGYDPSAEVGEDGFLRASVNAAYESSNSLAPGLIAGVVAAAILILLAGYLIIYNIFQLSVLKDIRLYGQLKTVGTSPKQLAYIVKRQGMRLSIIGIPAGLILGWLLGNALLPIIMKSLDGQTAYFVKPNILVMFVSAIFALFTVWISCKKPGRTAAKISPIEALKYSGHKNGKKTQTRGKESKMRIAQMALANLTGNKGKTLLVIVSIALSIVIFNSVLNFTSCFDKETFAKGRTAADFVVNSASFEQSDSSNYMVPEAFTKFIKEQKNLKNVSAVYYHHEPERQEHEIATIKTRNGKPYEDENDLGGKQVYGFDENALKRCKVVDGKIDLNKFATGKYVLEVGYLDDQGQKAEKDSFSLHPGDKVTVNFQGRERTYEVMANVACSYAMLSSGSIGDYGGLLLNTDQFHDLYPRETQPINYIFDAEKGAFKQVNTALQKYQDRPQAGIRIKSRITVDQDFEETKRTFSMTGVVLAGVFGIIGLLNLLNVILTGAIARRQEFAVMQSIGMTRKQLRKLFVLEGLFYAAAAILVGVLLSVIVSATVVKGLTAGWWFSVYHMTVLPACALAPVYLAAAVLISAMIDRMWNKGSVVERLRRTK